MRWLPECHLGVGGDTGGVARYNNRLLKTCGSWDLSNGDLHPGCPVLTRSRRTIVRRKSGSKFCKDRTHMKVDYLFWGSSALCVLSFVLFALQIIVQLWHMRKTPAPSGLGDVQSQALDPVKIIKETGDLARSFATSSPLVPTAVLTVIFALIAVLASGILKIA